MNQKRILLNAVTTFVQVAGSAATLFFLYRFLVRTIGVERLGIWSLVLATTSAVTLANQGFSTSVTKFVAKYAAREEPGGLVQLRQRHRAGPVEPLERDPVAGGWRAGHDPADDLPVQPAPPAMPEAGLAAATNAWRAAVEAARKS